MHIVKLKLESLVTWLKAAAQGALYFKSRNNLEDVAHHALSALPYVIHGLFLSL